jgi:hypothetical protein
MGGRIVLGLFLAAQLCDGLLTYLGISRFGAAAEANPLVGWYVSSIGAGPALLGAKSMAAGCGVALHLCARHGTVALLTLLYMAVAVVPWLHLL